MPQARGLLPQGANVTSTGAPINSIWHGFDTCLGLRAGERRLHPGEQRDGVVAVPQLRRGDPRLRPRSPAERGREGGLHAPGEPLGVAARGLGEKGGEAPAAEVEDDVRGAHRRAQAARCPAQEPVGGRGAQAEQEDAQRVLVAARTRALALQQPLEGPPAVEPGLGVEIRLAPQLVEGEGALERRAESRREALEAGELVVGRLALDAAPEDGERPDARVLPVDDPQGEPACEPELVPRELLLGVAVREGDRARLAAAGREAGELAGGLLRRQAERRDERLALRLR